MLKEMLSLPIYEQLIAYKLLAEQMDYLSRVWGDQPGVVRPQIEIEQIEYQLSKKFEDTDVLRNHFIHYQRWAIQLGISYQGATGNQFRIYFDRSLLPSTDPTGWYQIGRASCRERVLFEV